LNSILLLSISASLLISIAFAQRQRAQAASARLERERQLTRRLRDGSASGVLMVDTASKLTGWNPAMEQLTGISERKALRRGLSEFSAIAAPDLTDSVRLALQGVEMTAEFTVPSPAGAPVRLCAYSSPIRDDRGRVSGAMAIINPLHAAGRLPVRRGAAGLRTSAA